jgi:hypothetical protein
VSAPPVATAPSRPDTAPDARLPSRGIGGTLAVLGVILLVVLGGYVVAAALSEPAGPPVGIPGVVSIRPLSGWVVAGSSSADQAVRVTRGSGNLDTTVFPPDFADVQRLADRYVEVLSGQLSQLSVSKQLSAVRLSSGLRGVRFGYIGVVAGTGTSIEGEVTVVVASGHGVVFDGWAPAGLLSFVRSDIETMIDQAEFR